MHKKKYLYIWMYIFSKAKFCNYCTYTCADCKRVVKKQMSFLDWDFACLLVRSVLNEAICFYVLRILTVCSETKFRANIYTSMYVYIYKQLIATWSVFKLRDVGVKCNCCCQKTKHKKQNCVKWRSHWSNSVATCRSKAPTRQPRTYIKV